MSFFGGIVEGVEAWIEEELQSIEQGVVNTVTDLVDQVVFGGSETQEIEEPVRRRPEPIMPVTDKKYGDHARPTELKKGRGASGYVQHGNEVEVVPPPKRLALTAPDYFTVNLPYSIVDVHSAARAATGVNIRTFRLNSIFDPDSSSPVTHQPMGRDSWSNIYQYYRVLASAVRLTIINQQNDTETATLKNALVVGMEHTDDVSTSGVSQDVIAFMEGKNSRSRLLLGRDNSPANIVTMEFQYSPETWEDHVQEVGIEERWTPVGANPSFSHDLAIRHFPWVNTDMTATNLIYRLDVTYTVQFRELQYTVYKSVH